MSSHWHNWNGRFERGLNANRNDRFGQFQQRSFAPEIMPLPYLRYYQGTSHFQDRLVQNSLIDNQMDTQEGFDVDHPVSGAWSTQSYAPEAVHFGGRGHRFPGERGFRHYRKSGMADVAHRPIWKSRGLGPLRGGFHQGYPRRYGRGNVRSINRRQKDLQKKHEWTRLDHSLRGKGQDLKIDLGTDAAAKLSLDEIISKATDNTGRFQGRNKGPHQQNLKVESGSSSDAAVHLSLGEIISKSHSMNIN